MANLTQTAANVATGSAATVITLVQAGEAITQGQPVYQSSTTLKYLQTDANDTAAKADAKGIALTPAASDGYFVIVKSGPINLGATLTVGQLYVVSATKGAIAPIADLGSSDYVTSLGIATTSALLNLDISASGVQKP
jgi:hypothetical protein